MIAEIVNIPMRMFEFYPGEHTVYVSKFFKSSSGKKSVRVFVEDSQKRTLSFLLPSQEVEHFEGFSPSQVSDWISRMKSNQSIIFQLVKKFDSLLGPRYRQNRKIRIREAFACLGDDS